MNIAFANLPLDGGRGGSDGDADAHLSITSMNQVGLFVLAGVSDLRLLIGT